MRDAAARWAIVAEVGGAGCCAHPVRLAGTGVDRRTGEIAPKTVVVACKDRRVAVCSSCATLYRRDAWQLVAAGLRGGKGVPESVRAHPRLFVTLTAPSFGQVHRGGRDPGAPVPCQPRRNPVHCPHGVDLACFLRHRPSDDRIGQPLCARCFEYTGAVLWNAQASLLWQRTRERIVREVAHGGAVPVRRVHEVFRLSYLKVVEFQRRGLAHLHLVVRADGPEGPASFPPSWLDAAALDGAVRRAVGAVSVAAITGGARRVAWGSELDVRDLGGPDQRDGEHRDSEHRAGGPDTEAVAAYAAKYSTKSADGDGALARPVRSEAAIGRLAVNAHLRRLVRTAWVLGGDAELRALRLRDHAHTFGYPGHFATKSTRYSTTFGALRQARADYLKKHDVSDALEAGWRYAGRGYLQPGAQRLADALTVAGSDLNRDLT